MGSGCGELRACLPVSAQPSLLYFYLLTQAALFRRLPSGYSESHSNFTGRHADQGGQLPVVPLEIGVTSLSWFARKLPGFSTENPASWESIVPGQTGLLAPRIGPRLPVGPGTAALKGSSSGECSGLPLGPWCGVVAAGAAEQVGGGLGREAGLTPMAAGPSRADSHAVASQKGWN